MKRVIIVFMLLWASVAQGDHIADSIIYVPGQPLDLPVSMDLDVIPNAGPGNKINDRVRESNITRREGDKIAVELFWEPLHDIGPVYGLVFRLHEQYYKGNELRLIKIETISPKVVFLPLSKKHEPEHAYYIRYSDKFP